MFNKIVEFLFCADIIKTPKVFCLTFGGMSFLGD